MKQPIRVLHLAESPYFGGINSHIRIVVNAFRDHPSVCISVATLPGAGGDRWLFDALRDMPVYELAMRSRFDFGAARRLCDYVAGERFDIVHTHNYRATLLASYARLPVPVVNTCHGVIVEPSLKLRAYQALELRAMRRLQQTIAVSDYVRQWLMRKGVSAGNIRTIHNGYDPGPETASIDRNALGVPEGAVVYMFAGRLAHGKGIREFIDALRGIEHAFALVVGDGPLRADSEAVAHSGRVNAYFAGMQRDVSPYYRVADVVVLPSRMEALPMTLVEAAAHGKPVIASHVGGIPEVVRDGETGLLVKVRDHADLHAALNRLMDADLRARLGATAQRHWREHFTGDKMARELESLYTNISGH